MAIQQQAPSRPAPKIASAAEAEQALASFAGVMTELHGMLEEETALVRAGHVAKAMRLHPKKAELATRFVAAAERVKVNGQFLADTLPDQVRALHRQHEVLQPLLQKNLVVLATAHAVSEGIIRGVAGELARRSAPRTYGATGRTAPTPRSSHQPLAVSRTL